MTIQTEDLESADEGRIEGTYDLHDANGETVPGTLELSVQYISVANQDEAEKDKILPRAYFPPTENNRFILYQVYWPGLSVKSLACVFVLPLP